MRVRKRNWTEKELAENPLILSDGREHKGEWQTYFGNQNPVHVEIGCGKGHFITEMALANPDINYIAIEREKEVIVSGARKIRELQTQDHRTIGNIVFITGDATGIKEYFKDGEIGRIYINFCDPWPNKKKWAKRRLTHRNFLKCYKELMGSEGEIHFKTDNTQLFEFSLNEFAGEGWQLRNITLDLHKSEFEGNIMTEYERKFSEKGMPIYRLEAICKGNMPG